MIIKGIILISFFLFPATFYYFSPVVIIQSTLNGIVNGSFIMFLLMFVSALILGRAYCGWICPTKWKTANAFFVAPASMVVRSML